jgi:hypothetical protein
VFTFTVYDSAGRRAQLREPTWCRRRDGTQSHPRRAPRPRNAFPAGSRRRGPRTRPPR